MGIIDTPTVLFPVETIVRELNSKLALACGLAANGCRVIVGHKEEIRYIGHHSGPVVWQGKNLFSDDSSDHTADHLLRNGSAIMYMQDEGGMFQVDSWKENVIQKHHLDLVRTRAIRRMCAWGQRQAEVIAAYAPELSERIRVTGSARFDICSPRFGWMEETQIRQIRERFGDYVLLCTRFGAIAHADGIHDAFRRKLNPRIWPADISMQKVADIWFTKWRQDVHDFAEFVIYAKELADAYPSRKIVIRPHPSEGLLFYRQAFAQHPNVEVMREGNVLNWIRGADVVVHSNCTTGIEAVLADRPVLNLLPGDEGRNHLDVEVAREAGVIARSVQQALELTEFLLSHPTPPPYWSPHATSMLANIEHDAIPSLVEESLAVVREQAIGGAKLTFPPRRRLRKWVKGMLGRSEQSAYIAAKRGPLDRDHIDSVVEGCCKMGIGGGRIRVFTPQYVMIDPE